MTNRRTWLWVVVLLVFIMSISYMLLSQQPKSFPEYASNSPSPTGTKAIYTLLDQETGSLKRWSHSPDLLTTLDEPSILVMISPDWILQEDELEAYTDFMITGNTILLFSEFVEGMFGVESEMIQDIGPEVAVSVTRREDEEFQAEVSGYTRLQAGSNDEVIISDKHGTIALKQKFGEGALIVAVTPEWLRNDTILELEHVGLVTELFDETAGYESAIVFDEYIHDQTNDAVLTTVYPKWFILLMLQGILLTILWLWYRGKRFGPLFTVREEFVRFSDEGIQALSAWYLRGRQYADSLHIQADYVKLRMQERWGISYGVEWSDLNGQLERKWKGASKTEIASFLMGLQAVLHKRKMSKQEYLLWSNKIARLGKEVEKDETRINPITR